jgi:leucine-zipper of insertion element IS481
LAGGLLVSRIELDGWPAAKAAEAQGVSRTTPDKWIKRYRAEGGPAGRPKGPYDPPNLVRITRAPDGHRVPNKPARALRPVCGGVGMIKLFDGTFLAGTLLVVLALAIAVLAAVGRDLPWIGTGRGALIAVAVVGMAGCAIGGISQAPAIGWTHPVTLIGIVFGIAALTVIAAGLFGWEGVLQPIAGLVPGASGDGSSQTIRTAVVALAGIIAIKWLVAVVLATYARLT